MLEGEPGALAVRLFGPIRVDVPGGSLGPQDLGGAKPKQILEMLLLERGRAVSKDRLADQLWGEALPESVAGTLETYVSVLRRRLGSAREMIVTAPGGYRVDPRRVSVDLDEFDRLAQLGVTGEPLERAVHLRAAVGLSRDPLLADEPYAEWLLPVREQYTARHVQALVQLAECCLALDQLDEAAGWAEQALAADPLMERACRAAMVASYAAGRPARALRHFADLRAALADELGVEPTSETNHLGAAIRQGAPAETLLQSVRGRAPAIRFASNGPVRLAFQSFGQGARDIVFVDQFLTNLGATWDEPEYAVFLRRLAGLGRVTIFDKRGSGLSDPVVEWPSEQERCEDLRAVLDAAGVERAVVFGVCDGGDLCVRFAARYPERVAALVLFGVPARMLACPGFEWGWSEQFHAAFLDAFEGLWSRGAGFEAMDPSVATNPRYRALFARFLRLGASPGMARRFFANRDGDLRPILPSVQAPSLVLIRRGDPWVRPENSRYLATHLPRGQFLELDGADHEPWLGDAEPVFQALTRFLSATASPGSGSTRQTERFSKGRLATLLPSTTPAGSAGGGIYRVRRQAISGRGPNDSPRGRPGGSSPAA